MSSSLPRIPSGDQSVESAPPPPPPQLQRTPEKCASIMRRSSRVLLHAAVGTVILVQTRHAAATLMKANAVGIVNGKLVCANQHCLKLARRRVSREPMSARRVAHLWTIASNVSLRLGCGRRTSAENHGPQRQDPDHKVVSGTESLTSSATDLNQVPSTQVGSTKSEPRRESGQSAKWMSLRKSVDEGVDRLPAE